MDVAAQLEYDGRDVQDLEFTLESGRLWLLQSRPAKRTPAAAVRLAVTLAREGLISPAEALDRVGADQVEALLRPHLEPREQAAAEVLASGQPACPGVALGRVVCDTEEAEDRAMAGESIVLARPTTDPEDVPAFSVVRAILTELGGSTSHAAVVSREMGVPCVVGCGVDTVTALAGRQVTVDADAGRVFAGALPLAAPRDPARNDDLVNLLAWAREEDGAAEDHSLVTLLRRRAALRRG
jgi:pyruvate,orthophosphate dikinase